MEAWSDSEDDEDDKGEDIRDATVRAKATHEYWATYEKAQAATEEEMQQPEPYAEAQPFYPHATSYKREAGEGQQAPRKKRCVREQQCLRSRGSRVAIPPMVSHCSVSPNSAS